jgi:predicted ribosomally synthesized peptide with nif11-like leader
MSEEQLSALLAKLKDDAGLQEKLKGAVDLDAAVAMVKKAGFAISSEELQRAQAEFLGEISDEELENVAGATHGGGCRCCSTQRTTERGCTGW